MDKYKYLFKNIGFLTISQFSSKILVFFLIPLYTNILTTSEYGTYDLFYASICLLVPILTQNIADASLRYALDDSADYTSVFSVGLCFLLKGIIILVLGLCVNHVLKLSLIVDEYAFFFLLLFSSTAFTGIMTAFARGIDKVQELAISGVISTLTIIGLNLLLLLLMKWGLSGYFVANIVGVAAQGMYLLIRVQAWRYIKLSCINKKLQKEMVRYSRPLIANSVAWWVNSTSDRYIVIWFCGMAANGIYSVGYKIPSMLNIFQSIFNQAWTLSAVKDFDSDNSSRFFTNTYKMYNMLMVMACSAIIVVNRVLAKFLYGGDFYLAWQYVPFLLISVVFGSLSGHLGGILSATKDTSAMSRTTVYGSLMNVVLNILTVPFYGPIGAAVATMVSYWLTFVLRYKAVEKHVEIEVNLIRDFFSYGLMIIQSSFFLIWTEEHALLYLVEISLTLIIGLLYQEEICTIFINILGIRSKNGK